MRQQRLHAKHFNYPRVGATRYEQDADDQPYRERITEEDLAIGRGQARWKHA